MGISSILMLPVSTSTYGGRAMANSEREQLLMELCLKHRRTYSDSTMAALREAFAAGEEKMAECLRRYRQMHDDSAIFVKKRDGRCDCAECARAEALLKERDQ